MIQLRCPSRGRPTTGVMPTQPNYLKHEYPSAPLSTPKLEVPTYGTLYSCVDSGLGNKNINSRNEDPVILGTAIPSLQMFGTCCSGALVVLCGTRRSPHEPPNAQLVGSCGFHLLTSLRRSVGIGALRGLGLGYFEFSGHPLLCHPLSQNKAQSSLKPHLGPGFGKGVV